MSPASTRRSRASCWPWRFRSARASTRRSIPHRRANCWTEFDRTETGDLLVLTSKGQQEVIFAIGRANLQVLAPLLRLEHALHGLSAFLVMPLFAFSNAGVTLSGLNVDRVTLAVFLGLAIGKPLGITAASLAAVRARVAGLPQGVNWTAVHGCGWLGGIGFTMSLFIATLAFEGTPFLASAKVGILLASSFAGIIGATIVRAGSDVRNPRRRCSCACCCRRSADCGQFLTPSPTAKSAAANTGPVSGRRGLVMVDGRNVKVGSSAAA